MGSDLRRRAPHESSAHSAEFIASAARLKELHECSAVLRRTRMRAEEIVDEARALLAEAEQHGDTGRALELTGQLEQARGMYRTVLDAYVTICRKITRERHEILREHLGLSGVA
ncbi:hypothetical protein FH608_042845 [Nonomuraea phyllanthi]|uniref:Uncharacterized protein n=1 Tax=Nonomuraea phyllanthi TaxID=2219224 RepID=A0A5C4VG95_9ACTN|nr:hypothetical protein [Nonomuraea phyllanthi]KAB8188819.1 hypothetical protein FH608_042845 [Nonomuraea phyllanthi]QFY06021.1 hypothetical protein GBF35_04440 [Nonomuraea phyllanthi]